MASTSLNRTPSSNGSETKGTFSAWVKRSGITSAGNLYTSYQASNEFFDIQFNDTDQLQVVLLISGSHSLNLQTTAVYRDVSAWYHIVVVIDSTDSTQADRVKLYVNGVRETTFTTNTNRVSSSLNMRINSTAQNVYVGSWHNANYFDGLMSHVHWVDGTAYQASTFGSTDSATGEWKINTSPSVTYGTNGFFWLKDDITTTDHSPNSNTFTASGTLTKTLDCPSNVFCTLNPLGYASASFTLIEGNLYSGGADNNWRSIYGTLGASSGKFYYEVKCISSSDYERFGWCTVDQMNLYQDSSGRYDDNNLDEGYGYTSDGEKSNNGGTTAYGATWSAGHILSCAIDLDNQKIYWGKSGAWQNGGDPTSGSTGTGSAYNIEPNKIYVPAFASYGAASNLAFNFGNGYFRTTAITTNSGNGYSGAEGKSKFEYQPPTGYSALCTRGLNE